MDSVMGSIFTLQTSSLRLRLRLFTHWTLVTLFSGHSPRIHCPCASASQFARAGIIVLWRPTTRLSQLHSSLPSIISAPQTSDSLLTLWLDLHSAPMSTVWHRVQLVNLESAFIAT